MPLIPLDIPPGGYRNGTEFDQSGRWRDMNLVRWRDGSLRPIGGWRLRAATAYTGVPRGMIAWEDLAGDRRVAVGTFSNLYSTSASGTTTDITPAGFTSGNEIAAVNTGFGGLTQETLPRRQLGRWATGVNTLLRVQTPTARFTSGSLTWLQMRL